MSHALNWFDHDFRAWLDDMYSALGRWAQLYRKRWAPGRHRHGTVSGWDLAHQYLWFHTLWQHSLAEKGIWGAIELYDHAQETQGAPGSPAGPNL